MQPTLAIWTAFASSLPCAGSKVQTRLECKRPCKARHLLTHYIFCAFGNLTKGTPAYLCELWVLVDDVGLGGDCAML